MKLKNRAKSNGRIGYLLGLITVLSLTVLTAKAQSDVFSTNSYNAEMKRIDDEFHDCTRCNRGNHQGIQNCIDTARNAKRQLAKLRNNNSGIKIADNSGYQKGNINTDVIQTNGGDNRPKSQKPYYPPYPTFPQTPKSAPQSKQKIIKGGTNTNQKNQPDKPVSLPQKTAQPKKMLIGYASVDYKRKKLNYTFDVPADFPTKRETGIEVKLVGTQLNDYKNGNPVVAGAWGKRIDGNWFHITKVWVRPEGVKTPNDEQTVEIPTNFRVQLYPKN